MIKSRPSNGLIPQQGGARGIKTMVIRVDRLKKKKKKELFSIQSMMMKLTRGRWTNLVLYMYTREWNTCTDTWHMWYLLCCAFLLSACIADPWSGWSPVRDCFASLSVVTWLFCSFPWHGTWQSLHASSSSVWFAHDSGPTITIYMCVIGPPL